MASRIVLAHIPAMAERTCKPDSDMKRLWRMLLPGVAFPACGSAGEVDDATAMDAAASQPSRAAAAPADGRIKMPR